MKNINNIVKIRWVNNQCWQIVTPEGLSILLDPNFKEMRDEAKDMPDYQWNCKGFAAKDLGRVDYVLVNHTHVDHVVSIRDVYDEFEPIILCPGHVARPLALYYDIPEVNFFPLDNNALYRFDDFDLRTLPGKHSFVLFKGKRPSSAPVPDMKKLYGMENETELAGLGTIFNTNYCLTLSNNFKIGISAGNFDFFPRDWETERPQILFRHRTLFRNPNFATEMADAIIKAHATLMLPLHQTEPFDKMQGYVDQVNAELDRRGYYGRMINPEKNRWYEICLGIHFVDAPF